MFVIDVRSPPAILMVLSFASIAEIAIVEVVSGEIESEVMVVVHSYQSKYVKINSRADRLDVQTD
jgi:hypothetical protein